MVLSHSKPQELVRVKRLIDLVRFDEANQLIKEFEEKQDHALYDKVLCNLLKCDILYYQGVYDEVIKLAEQTYKESLGLGKNLLSVDALLRMAHALFDYRQWEKSYDRIKQGEELLKALTHELPEEYKRRKAYLALLKGHYYEENNKLDKSIQQFELSVSLQEELGNKIDMVWPILGIAGIFYWNKGDFNRALKYLERGLATAKESGNLRCIGACLNQMAYLHFLKGEFDHSIMLFEKSLTIFDETNLDLWRARIFCLLGECYAMKGEINRSIRFFEQSLELWKKLKHKPMMADILNNVSECYRMKGELEHALDCIEQSMALNHELGNLERLANNHLYFIKILIDRGELTRAWNSLRDLEQLNNQLKDEKINFYYLFVKALLLKTSMRARNRVKAEEIFNQILEEKLYMDIDYELTMGSLLNLCELLLIELRLINEEEILDEIDPLIVRLIDSAEKSNSYWILGETYLLRAKLSLLTFDIKKAQQFLTQAQKIAESYGIKRLAMQISYEHDELLKQTKIWENLKETEAPLSERWELAGLNDQIEKTVRKRMIESPEISEEDPVMILILTEGGNLLFSQKFASDFSFEEDLLGSFLTTTHYFINAAFSEGLDRAVFGQYTLLMTPLQPFLVCYIFKGYSYSAQFKISSFIDSIQNDRKVWQSLQKFFQLSKSVHVNDVPMLDSLITNIFVKKTLQ
jgi:tetratricopeptide (TPR) repeat protein